MKKGVFKYMATAVPIVGLLSVLGSTGALNNQNEIQDGDRVSFAFSLFGKPVAPDYRYTVELVCGEKPAAAAAFSSSSPGKATRSHGAAGQRCYVRITGDDKMRMGDEVAITVTHNGKVISRRTLYPEGETAAVSSDFFAPPGELHVSADLEMTDKPLGTRLRVMEWNIWLGGREAGGEKNVDHLIRLIREHDADILFILETYGSGKKILEGLNAGQPEERRYTGTRITERPNQPEDKDNLWIFTRYPLVRKYPAINEKELDSFNFGGIKVRLPDGQEINLFNIWLWHAPSAWGSVSKTVSEIQSKRPRMYTDQQIVATDEERRLKMSQIVLDDRLPRYVGDDPSPVILAGDFNTLSYRDWSGDFADAPDHGGLILPWPVTKLFEEAGFTDTYRWTHPDAGRFPGPTWSPYKGYGHAPGRIDFIWTRGSQVRILDSYTVDRRLPGHEDPSHPFYSDHAAVVTDLMVRSGR